MKSIIDRKQLKDMTIDTRKFNGAHVAFVNARKEYHDAKQAYNKFKAYKVMRMNSNTIEMIKKLYKNLTDARKKYQEAKRYLNQAAIATFTLTVSLKMNKKEIGALGAKLIELYRSSETKEDELVEFKIHTDRRGRIL
jgi:Fic family protein